MTFSGLAGIYTRISLDRDGHSGAPERQEADCRSFAHARDWKVVDVYCDRDASAFRRGAKRPELDRMVGDLRAGRVDVVLVWKLDRLTRQGISGLAKVLDLLDDLGGRLVAIQDGIDTGTGAGELVAAVIASIAKQESLNTSVRVAASHRHAAAAGQMHAGGSRQFGYERSALSHAYLGIHPKEASVVREVAERILGGESLRRIAFDLNERGIRTPGTKGHPDGKKWYTSTLRQMIRSPRLAGLRTHNGVIHPGNWEPILTEDQHRGLLAALSRPPSPPQSVARHLLTGLCECALCGGKLKTMGFRMKNGKPFERYQCVKQPGEVNCGRIAIAKNSLDRHVIEEVLAFFSSMELRHPSSIRAKEIECLLDEDRQALAELTEARFVQRSIRPVDYAVTRRLLEDRIADGEAQLFAMPHRPDDELLTMYLGNRPQLDSWWASADQEARRLALRQALSRVVVSPARSGGGNRFDSTRARLDYRQNPFFDPNDGVYGRSTTPNQRLHLSKADVRDSG